MSTGVKHSTRGIDLHRLEREFGGAFDDAAIEGVVRTLYDEIEPAAEVTTFVPLLVERFAREQLLAAARANSIALGQRN